MKAFQVKAVTRADWTTRPPKLKCGEVLYESDDLIDCLDFVAKKTMGKVAVTRTRDGVLMASRVNVLDQLCKLAMHEGKVVRWDPRGTQDPYAKGRFTFIFDPTKKGAKP